MQDISLRTQKKCKALKVLIKAPCSSPWMRKVSEETFQETKHVGYGNTRAEQQLPRVCVHDWGIFDQVTSPCRTSCMSLDIQEQMCAIPHVSNPSMANVWCVNKKLTCSVTCLSDGENSFWYWMVNPFVLWSKEIGIFVLGCVTGSNAVIPQVADEPFTPVLQFFSKRRIFFLWIALLNTHECFLDFCVHCNMKRYVSMTLINTLRLSRTKWGHRLSRIEKLNMTIAY